MSASEKLSILGDFRKVLQDFLAPELREIAANMKALSENQKDFSENLREGLKAQGDSQREMETRLLREIKNSEEKIVLLLKLSETTGKLEQVTRENQELKREKTQ